MINYISTWAKQIIICVIAVTVLEMILPKGNSKKYIKTIMGIYILYTIIQPAIKLITGKNIKVNYSDYSKYFNNKTEQVNVDEYNAKVEETYKQELEKQIKSDVENMGYFVNKVNIEFNLEEGIIKNVEIIISKKEKNTNNINITVNKIDIGEKPKNDVIDDDETKKIKQKINENYGVDNNNIEVSLA